MPRTSICKMADHQRTCLGRSQAVSNASLDLPPLSRFSTTWGICFSLKGNPSRLSTRGFVTVLPRFVSTPRSVDHRECKRTDRPTKAVEARLLRWTHHSRNLGWRPEPGYYEEASW